MTYSSDAYRAADEVIADLTKVGHDYSEGREEIARIFDEYLWNGNWDMTTDFENGLVDLRFIQEDEYDQHMNEEDKPDWNEMAVYSSCHYVWLE